MFCRGSSCHYKSSYKLNRTIRAMMTISGFSHYVFGSAETILKVCESLKEIHTALPRLVWGCSLNPNCGLRATWSQLLRLTPSTKTMAPKERKGDNSLLFLVRFGATSLIIQNSVVDTHLSPIFTGTELASSSDSINIRLGIIGFVFWSTIWLAVLIRHVLPLKIKNTNIIPA